MCIIVYTVVAVVIETGPQLQDVIVKEPFTLTCYATGYPVPSIMWTQNGSPFLSNYYHTISIVEGLRSNASVLVITHAMVSDTGIYQCIATNVVNNDTQDANVTVRG